MAKHYVNETGTDLIFDCGVLTATADFRYIYYEDPTGATGTWTASSYSSYSALAEATGSYFLSYTLDYGDFNVSGEWKLQAYMGASDGTWYGETVKLNIYDNFE